MKLLQLTTLLLALLAMAAAVQAKDITFSVNQSEYYFTTGEAAVIPLQVENTYGQPIDGTLTYTITQEANQGGFSYSSSNTNSETFTATQGKNTGMLNFGTSSSPATLTAKMNFDYDSNGPRTIDMKSITIHFVSSQPKNQNTGKAQQSSSKKAAQPQQTQTQQQSQQQALQNSQMPQDTSALKQQMEQQLQEQQQMKQQFQQELSRNNQFRNAHQQLMQEGYNLSAASTSPESNNTGNFDVSYQNRNGEKAEMTGRMENGSITQLETTDEAKIMQMLRNDTRFQNYNGQLEKSGYQMQKKELEKESNTTKVQIAYTNAGNQNATIHATIEGNTVQKVELQEESTKKSYWWLLAPAAIAAITAAYIYYKKKKTTKEAPQKEEKPFDYQAEARKMLEEARKLFEEEKHKDAYGKAGQSLRMFLSHKNGLKKETTNSEILRQLRKSQSYREVKECLELCSLVEFAKYTANAKDFSKIIRLAEKLLYRGTAEKHISIVT